MKKIGIILLLNLSYTLWAFEKLPIPQILESSDLNLYMQHGTITLPSGTSKTMGFNGNFLGPTIRVSNGELVKFKIKNNLKENSTVHWHGLHVPAEFDGGPRQIIYSGKTWNPEFRIDQSAATLWYHPHLMGKTAEHLYNGLAGMFYIEDDYSKKLDIPKNYGINDIPIVLQDRRLSKSGEFIYNPEPHDLSQGYIGNIMLINGVVEPEITISKGTYRFRILNGSNSSIYTVSFSDNRKFTVIASDGGFLPKTVKENTLIMSPGERFEILVDFNSKQEVFLITDIYRGDSFKSLSIKTTDKNGQFFDHPLILRYKPITFNSNTDIKRTFIMETKSMNNFTINGKRMNINRIDFSLKKNSTEIWTIKNIVRGMMYSPHSFHVHDVQFSILSINGEKPRPLYSGPKDTILLMPGEEIKIALRFEDYTGTYMYHCHFLEHEDNGMMGQFEIE